MILPLGAEIIRSAQPRAQPRAQLATEREELVDEFISRRDHATCSGVTGACENHVDELLRKIDIGKFQRTAHESTSTEVAWLRDEWRTGVWSRAEDVVAAVDETFWIRELRKRDLTDGASETVRERTSDRAVFADGEVRERTDGRSILIDGCEIRRGVSQTRYRIGTRVEVHVDSQWRHCTIRARDGECLIGRTQESTARVKLHFAQTDEARCSIVVIALRNELPRRTTARSGCLKHEGEIDGEWCAE